MKNIAVVLAGSGAKDGAEITEAVSLLIALSQAGYGIQCFAPDRLQHHVVNHLTGEEEKSQQRNILVEAARIARGKILPLSQLSAAKFVGLAFGGGFGVAKNLCNFATEGVEAHIEADIKAVLQDFYRAKKPIAALCISPVLLALFARDASLKGVRITLGADGTPPVQAVKQWGLVHQPCPVTEACIDPQHKFVSAPAYMYDNASPADIFASAKALVAGLATLV